MARIEWKPKYTRSYIDRGGVRRWEFRRAGFQSRRLPGPPGTPGFEEAYQAALTGSPKPIAAAVRTKAGSMNDLAVRFTADYAFRASSPQNQKNFNSHLSRVREKFGDLPVALLDRRGMRRILKDCANTPHQSNKLLKVMKRVLTLAIDEGMIESNPAAGMKPIPVKSEGFHAWSDEEIALFRAKHPSGTRARLALELALCTGQRRSDVVRMGWAHVKDGMIFVRQQKTAAELWLPILPTLAAELARIPREQVTFLQTENGKPFIVSGFGNWFRDVCVEAGVEGRMHGLRKAAARILNEAGCTERQIMAITGHKHTTEVTRYTESSDQKKLAKQAIEILNVSRQEKQDRQNED